MRVKLDKVWQLFSLAIDSIETLVKQWPVRSRAENWKRPISEDLNTEVLWQSPAAHLGSFRVCRALRVAWIVMFLGMMLAIPTTSRGQTQQETKPTATEPVPEPAISAILAAFDRYEVIAMPEDHGLKDLDDFIFALVRNPAFPGKVNDIVIECGNSLYQPVLDRYIAGEDVPLTEARKVWRNTTQPICGGWGFGFFEQLYALLRAINQKLPS